MEYMRIEGFIGKAVSKLINKAVESKVGFKPGIELESLTFKDAHAPKTDEELVAVYLTATMSREAFEKLIEEVTK